MKASARWLADRAWALVGHGMRFHAARICRPECSWRRLGKEMRFTPTACLRYARACTDVVAAQFANPVSCPSTSQIQLSALDDLRYAGRLLFSVDCFRSAIVLAVECVHRAGESAIGGLVDAAALPVIRDSLAYSGVMPPHATSRRMREGVVSVTV